MSGIFPSQNCLERNCWIMPSAFSHYVSGGGESNLAVPYSSKLLLRAPLCPELGEGGEQSCCCPDLRGAQGPRMPPSSSLRTGAYWASSIGHCGLVWGHGPSSSLLAIPCAYNIGRLCGPTNTGTEIASDPCMGRVRLILPSFSAIGTDMAL